MTSNINDKVNLTRLLQIIDKKLSNINNLEIFKEKYETANSEMTQLETFIERQEEEEMLKMLEEFKNS